MNMSMDDNSLQIDLGSSRKNMKSVRSIKPSRHVLEHPDESDQSVDYSDLKLLDPERRVTSKAHDQIVRRNT